MPTATIRFTEREDLSPICPFCEKYLDEMYVKRRGLTDATETSAVFFCPFCLKILGFAPPAKAAVG
ncbi:hypothetical protein GF420_07615 [candidate division GN15 bacterium]|nr:hypothetical protein [candidate division GN15 bacterium]